MKTPLDNNDENSNTPSDMILTPRTDSTEFPSDNAYHLSQHANVVPASFARTLERELAEAEDLMSNADERESELYWRNQYEEACMKIADMHEAIEALAWAVDNRISIVRINDTWELYFPSRGLPSATGTSRDEVIAKARTLPTP